MLRMAGWCSGFFFLLLGGWFAINTLSILSEHRRNVTQWWLAVYSLMPIAYGLSVIWRLNRPVNKLVPLPMDEVEAHNDAELLALIQQHHGSNHASGGGDVPCRDSPGTGM
jgi:hypothetical protein